MIYTSRFSNPELQSGNYTVVGIVRYLPRYKLKYELAGNIFAVAPTKALFNVYDRAEFTPPYKAHLEEVGFEKISEQIHRYVTPSKDLVLCCYEDVRIPDEWCHRLVFAEWWLEQTGEIIPELKDDSPIKIKRKVQAEKTPQVVQTSIFVNPQEERWLEGARIDSTGRYYIVPELSYKGFERNANWNPCFYIVTTDLKLRRIGLKFAVELVNKGQAIEISKEEIAVLKKEKPSLA